MRLVLVLAGLALGLAGCGSTPAPRRYELAGQILAVHAAERQLTIAHQDIPNFMPGMTMTFDVAPVGLLDGRAPGELVRATLEVTDAKGVIVAVTHVGEAPLPDPATAHLAEGIVQVGDAAPDAALIDQADRRRAFSEWKGTPTLLTFIYTRCPLPNFCPLMDQNFSTIQRAVAEDAALRGRVKLVTVSFDPAHDTPAVLALHAARRRADAAVWTFLTGDLVTVERFAGKFGVSLLRTPPTSAEITHNLRTFLIDADGRVAKIYSGNDWTPSAVLADLRRTVRRS